MENTVLQLDGHHIDKITEIERFKDLSLKLTHIIKSQDINLITDLTRCADRLFEIPNNTLQVINNHLAQNIHVIESSLFGGKIGNKQIVKNILGFMKYTAPSDFIDKVTEEDIVEIYNLENIQVFRNLKFYETTTYSLSDLLLYDWPELYTRPAKMTEKLLAIVGDVIRHPSNELVQEMSFVPVHYLKEIRANPVQLCEVRFKYISPILDYAGERAGFIVSCTAKSMRGTLEPRELTFI